MQRSESIGALAAALAKAQSQMGGVQKDAANEAFKRGRDVSRYATLASAIDAVRGPLSANGLAYVQAPELGPGGEVVVTTTLMHSSGEWLATQTAAKPSKSDPQGIGSAITYLRRYGLMAVCGVAPDDDDDGNAASDVAPARKKKEAPEEKAERQAGHHASFTDAERKAFASSCTALDLPGKHGLDEVSAFAEWLGKPRPSGMEPAQRAGLVQWLGTDAGRDRWVSWMERS